MLVDLVMPKCGLTMREATIVRWVKDQGDLVAAGDPVLEIETEKAIIEVPALDTGKIVRCIAKTGTVMQVGEILAVLEVAERLGVPSSLVLPDTSAKQDIGTTTASVVPVASRKSRREGRASPLARRIARELRVDLGSIEGTGPSGVVTEADVRAAASEKQAPVKEFAPDRTEVLSAMRKAIGSAMRRSVAEAPQVTLSRETGMAGVLGLRRGLPDDITITDVILAVAARTLARHPRLNAHIVNDELRLFGTVNVGIAIALENGLVTPVLRNLSRKSLTEISSLRRKLVNEARAKNLRQSDLEGGTFTITNLGSYGIDVFTPIINPPQVAILGVGVVKPRPSILGGVVVARETCVLSLTFDHRALDGAPAALFLADLADILDDPRRLKDELQ